MSQARCHGARWFESSPPFELRGDIGVTGEPLGTYAASPRTQLAVLSAGPSSADRANVFALISYTALISRERGSGARTVVPAGRRTRSAAGANWFNALERAILTLDQHPDRCPVAPEASTQTTRFECLATAGSLTCTASLHGRPQRPHHARGACKARRQATAHRRRITGRVSLDQPDHLIEPRLDCFRHGG